MVQKFSFAIRFIILFIYLNFQNAPETQAFVPFSWYSLHCIAYYWYLFEQQLALAMLTHLTLRYRM